MTFQNEIYLTFYVKWNSILVSTQETILILFLRIISKNFVIAVP